MSREEFMKRLKKAQEALNNVERTLNITNIPTYYLSTYLVDEIGLDLSNDKYYQ